MAIIDNSFIIRQYQSGVENYKEAALSLGLWESEKYVFNKYLGKNDFILDLGCGAGRTTFALYKAGYLHLTGVDLTPDMINAAQEINQNFGLNVPFLVGDATRLEFETGEFDAAIFSFNGIMSIPGSDNRLKAFSEIQRVLKPGGIFIFTTHDREADPKFLEFWKEEKLKWEKGEQNPTLPEFGDLLTTSKNETREIYIHITDRMEVETTLTDAGFEVVETFYRSDKFDEPGPVKQRSGECRFWVVRKPD